MIFKAEEYITDEGLNNSSAKIYPVDTVLVAMYGATAGQVGLLKFKSSTNQAICGILPNEKFIPEFLYWILKSQREKMVQLSGGGAQPNISQSIIKKLIIPLPPLEVQKEIVTHLANYQKIIDGAKQVIDNYKPEIKIDPNWEIAELQDICKIIMGQSPPGEFYNTDGKGTPLINGPVEFGPTPFSKTVKSKYTTTITKMCRENDLILCVRGSTTGRMNIAGFDACIGRGVAAIRSEKYQKYVNIIINLERQQIYDLGYGSTFPNINYSELGQIKIPLPPLDIQKEIVSRIEEEHQIVDANKKLIELYQEKIKEKIDEVWGG